MRTIVTTDQIGVKLCVKTRGPTLVSGFEV